ncbi:MAG: Dna2/Cas4 domain-containing protein [Euryarchaeota archaeon]|nr:Dna2/Cas4 domain-containing protein [Euryarchaeota archaeon]
MKKVISASEVGSYIFCPRAWHMRRHGVSMPDAGARLRLAHGSEKHAAHAAQVEGTVRMARGMMVFSLLAALSSLLYLLTTTAFFLYLSAISVVSTMVMVLLTRRGRRETGVRGAVVYTDAKGKPLFSRRLLLTGRPDYLVQQEGMTVPVEFKARPAPVVPYASHIGQLHSYCLLVEEVMGTSPGFGVLRYEDREFRIPYTPRERLTLLGRLREMRHIMALGSRPPGQRDNRCTVCGYRTLCGF